MYDKHRCTRVRVDFNGDLGRYVGTDRCQCCHALGGAGEGRMEVYYVVNTDKHGKGSTSRSPRCRDRWKAVGGR